MKVEYRVAKDSKIICEMYGVRIIDWQKLILTSLTIIGCALMVL